MGFTRFVASKYISGKSNKKFYSLISLITIIGIALGVSIMIITLSILDGFESTITKKIIDFNSHIKITAFGNKNLEVSEENLSLIGETIGDNLLEINPFISKLSIIKANQHSEGISLLGVNKTGKEFEITKYIKEGSLDSLSSKHFPRIALGSKLTDKLFISLGDTVTIFSLKNDQVPSPVNPPAIFQFRVDAIYQSGMKEYDDIYGYIDLNNMRELLDLGPIVSGYNIKLKSINNADSLASFLQENLSYPHYVRSIFSLHQNIFTWLDLQKKPIPLILALIIIVAVFNIVGTLLINVLEKTKEIGILKSMGAKGNQILKIFSFQGTFLGIIGIVTGNIIALLVSFLQNQFNIVSIPQSVYYLSSVPIEINFFNYTVISLLAIILCLGASLIPSLIASRVKPVSAMKFD